MKLISTLIFLLCVTFAFAECYDNHFDECRIERQNGKYGIVIDKQLAIPYEYDEIVPQHNCFFKVRKGRKYGIISYFYEEHKRDGRFPKEIDRPPGDRSSPRHRWAAAAPATRTPSRR